MKKQKLQTVKSLFFATPLLALSACGGFQAQQAEPGPQACPASVMIPNHTMSVTLDQAPPAKLAVILEGTKKFDECLQQPVDPSPPITQLRRGNGNQVVVTVQHFGAYKTLPKDVTFSLVDRGDCKDGSEKEVFAATHQPLVFKTVYPYGRPCGANTTAAIELKK